MRLRLILLTAAGSLFAWQEPTIRVDVQQVLVPVVVTDKKGHHVSGLRASDFQISEDGVRQEIASFSSEKAGSVDDVASLARTVPGGGPAAPQAGPRHTFVICIDSLHASLADAALVRHSLESLFEAEKPAGAQYVLISIGRRLQVLQPATANPLEVLVKIRSAVWQNAMPGLDASALAAQLQNIRSRMDDFCRRCACGTRSNQQNCDSEVDTLKQSIDAEAERWIAPSNKLLEQFRSVVEELAQLPTSRTLILVSDGFNIDPKREFYAAVSAYLPDRPQFHLDNSRSDAPDLWSALKIAAERNITIDTVDSRGAGAIASTGAESMDASASGGIGGRTGLGDMLGTNRPPPSSSRTGPIQSSSNPQGSAPTPQKSVTMEQIAESTGGVYFHERSDMLKQFRSALADGREYYVLAYVPKNSARDGKFRTITVEATDKKLTIRAKAGYWAAQ
jgi:VWFA-related protein